MLDLIVGGVSMSVCNIVVLEAGIMLISLLKLMVPVLTLPRLKLGILLAIRLRW